MNREEYVERYKKVLKTLSPEKKYVWESRIKKSLESSNLEPHEWCHRLEMFAYHHLAQDYIKAVRVFFYSTDLPAPEDALNIEDYAYDIETFGSKELENFRFEELGMKFGLLYKFLKENYPHFYEV